MNRGSLSSCWRAVDEAQAPHIAPHFPGLCSLRLQQVVSAVDLSWSLCRPSYGDCLCATRSARRRGGHYEHKPRRLASARRISFGGACRGCNPCSVGEASGVGSIAELITVKLKNFQSSSRAVAQDYVPDAGLTGGRDYESPVSLSSWEDHAGLNIESSGANYLLMVVGKTVWLLPTSSLNKGVHSTQNTKGKEERIGGFRVWGRCHKLQTFQTLHNLINRRIGFNRNGESFGC